MASRTPRLLDEAGLRAYALRILGARAHSAGELRDKLQKRAFRASDVDAVIKQLKEYGYLNDEQFAETFAYARRTSDGLGKARVLRDLRQRRVAPSVAQKAVDQAFEGIDELSLIEDYLARKYRNVDLSQLLQTPAKLASVYRRLRHAGYSSGSSIRVLKRYASQAEQLDSLEEGLSEDEDS